MAVLTDLLEFTRDGEWGSGEADQGLIEVGIIRGTDFSSVRYGDLSGIPTRYVRASVVEKKQLKPRDILIETAGGTKDQPTGRTVYLKKDLFERANKPLLCASFARFLRVQEGAVDPRYLFWKLQDEYIREELLPFHVQHTGVARFQYTQFATNHRLALPAELEDQAAIASVLSSLDDKIELNRRMNNTLEALAQAIFKDWFVDFGPTRRKNEGATDAVAILGNLIPNPATAQKTAALFPDSFGDDGLPEGWTSKQLTQLLEVNPREPLKKGLVAPYSDMSSLPTQGPTAQLPIQREFSSGMRFRNGDALIARITPCLENGKAAFVDYLLDGQIGWGSTEFIVLRTKHPIPQPFGYLLVRHPEFVAHAIQSMTGTSGRQRAQEQAIGQFKIVDANEGVFLAFGELVVPLFANISANALEDRTLAETRDYLLPKLMSGEVRVRDVEKAVS